jgi:hypothetical protein
MNSSSGGIFDPEDAESPETLAEKPGSERQRGVERDSSRYYETGRASVGIGADGLPVVGGDLPEGPSEGLTDSNMICNATEDGSRKECEWYTAVLLPADGIAKGFDEMREIRRFCRLLATASELWEITGNLYACTSRSPQDLVSISKVKNFELRQKKAAREAAEKSGKLDF